MEKRTRPYLQQHHDVDTVDKFLRNNPLPSYKSIATLFPTKFSTDNFERKKYSNSASKYSTEFHTKTQNSLPFLSPRYNNLSDKKRQTTEQQYTSPLYNLSRKSSNKYLTKPEYDENQARTYTYGEPEWTLRYPVQQQKQTAHDVSERNKDEAKKNKSAFKSLRSFFKKHLGKTDYSSTPISKRFLSAQDVNGALPLSHSSQIAHHRSSSISSSTNCFSRPQSFSLPRDRPATSVPRITLHSNNAKFSLMHLTDPSKMNNKLQQTTENISTAETSNAQILTNNTQSSINLSNKSKEGNNIAQPNIPCLKGLANHGNTCYFSAIMQCLVSCDYFAERIICGNSLMKGDDNLLKALASTLCCLWFNNYLADTSFLKTLRLIGKANQQFVISHQQDAHECLIWLLDKLHEEIKEDEFKSSHSEDIKFQHTTHKSEGELAIDALEKISGNKRSTVMDLFRAQFRSAMECTNPVCGFVNLTFDPYLSISLSVPLPKRRRQISVLFIPFFSSRQIVRYRFNINNSLCTVQQVKELIMGKINGLPEDTVACHILPNGQCQFLFNDFQIDDRFDEFMLIEVPKLNEQQKMQDLIVAIVIFVVGIVPEGEHYGFPYVAVLNRQWSYDRIVNFLLDKGSFLLPRAFYPLPSDYTLLIQHSNESVACLDPGMGMPLFHDSVNSLLNDKEMKSEKLLKLIIEWSSSLRHEFSRAPTESVVNDYSFLRDRLQYDYKEYAEYDQQIPIPLVELIEDYVKQETIQDWKCPKCGKSSGRKELKFHSLPDILIFHLKRFELLNNGITKKIDSRVHVPLDGLDMAPYVFNSDFKASTLPKHRRDRNALEYFYKDLMLYDLTGVVNHFGERTNSGHYTATARNPVDSQWRIFDDSRVSDPIDPGKEIRTSTKSYLLFYQRRMQEKPASVNNWFPKNIPKQILDETFKRSSEMPNENVLMSGSSKFYTGTAVRDVEENSIPRYSSSQKIPLTPISIRRSSPVDKPLYNTTSRHYTYFTSPRLNTTISNSMTSPRSSTTRLDHSRYTSYRF